MSRELVPELHDVFKLTDVKQDEPDLSRYGPEPATATWTGVRCHQSFNEALRPRDHETFVLHVADGVAASISRHLNPYRLSGKRFDDDPEAAEFIRTLSSRAAPGIVRPWRQTEDRAPQKLTGEQVRELLEFLARDPSFEEFIAHSPGGLGGMTYGDLLRDQPEDKNVLRRITSLATHVRLVGKLYRLLLPVIQGPPVAPMATKNALDVYTQEVQGELRVQVHRVRVHFSQQPFRTRDLSVLLRLQSLVEEVESQFADSVIMAQPDELVLIATDEGLLEKLARHFNQQGFWLEVLSAQETLEDLRASSVAALATKPHPSTGSAVASPGVVPSHHFPELPTEIHPPLCEICQLAHADREWPRDSINAPEGERDGSQDALCARCFNLREAEKAMGVRLAKLADWTDLGGAQVAWFRLALDYDRLVPALQDLYFGYLCDSRQAALTGRSKPVPEVKREWAEIRFPLIAEFWDEYEMFVGRLGQQIRGAFGEDRTETILPGFFAIRAEAGSDVFSALTCFAGVVREFFPAFFDLAEAPLRVSLALCDVKYPFFEVWRGWQAQPSEIEITAAGQGGVQFRLAQLEKFLELADFPFRQSALHNLAEIARISQSLAELRFRAGGEKGECETYKRLNEFLPLGLGFDGILTLAKLRS